MPVMMSDLLRLHELEDSVENWRRLVAGYLKRLPSALAGHRGTVLPGVAALLEQSLLQQSRDR